MNEATGKITVLGLGSGGMKILNALAALPAAAKLNLLTVDTDVNTIGASKLPESAQLLADVQWLHGHGCGGDCQKGQRAIARERDNIENRVAGSSYLIVTGGLGGGLATGGVEAIASLCSKLKMPTIYMMTIPFSWEGDAKRQKADAAAAELLMSSDVLLLLPNDLLFSVLLPETPAAEAFKLADTEMARAIIAIAEMLGNGNMIGADFSDLQAMFKERKCYCSLGVGVASTAEGPNAGQLAVDRTLAAPLLGGIGKLKEADAVLFSVLGGPELGIAAVQQTMQAAGKCLPEGCELAIGVNTSPEYAGCVLSSLLAIKYNDRAKIKPRRKTPALVEVEQTAAPAEDNAGNSEPKQLVFELVNTPLSRGIFANSPQVSYNGEDLDVPTFQRRDVQIDQGD